MMWFGEGCSGSQEGDKVLADAAAQEASNDEEDLSLVPTAGGVAPLHAQHASDASTPFSSAQSLNWPRRKSQFGP